MRTATISTHLPMARRADGAVVPTLEGGDAEDSVPETLEVVRRQMDETLAHRAEEIVRATRGAMDASPRTFERFTARDHGLVGGAPRRAGLHHYVRLSPLQPLPGLYMVGDSVFPGQSTLATAIGGVKVADSIVPRKDRSIAWLPRVGHQERSSGHGR